MKLKTYNVEYDTTIEVVEAWDFNIQDGALVFKDKQGNATYALGYGWKRVWIVEQTDRSPTGTT